MPRKIHQFLPYNGKMETEWLCLRFPPEEVKRHNAISLILKHRNELSYSSKEALSRITGRFVDQRLTKFIKWKKVAQKY